MKNNNSYINSDNGNVSWNGELSIQKGDHSNMPYRTDAYLPGDERGHINASSLGGTNSTDNVVAQNAELNHGAYYSMEQGERTALQNGASIDSSKTAIVDSEPGNRPDVFLVSDNVTYADGHSELISHSFTNESIATQEAWNDCSAVLPDTFDVQNSADALDVPMSSAEYAELMEETEAALPGIAEDYAAADFSGVPASCVAEADTAFADTGGAGYPAYPEGIHDYGEVGLWTHPDHISGELHYFFGFLTDSTEIPDGFHKVEIPAGRYAVFTIKSQETPEKTADAVRDGWRYVFTEWLCTQKEYKISHQGMCFECYQGEEAYLYLPVIDL